MAIRQRRSHVTAVVLVVALLLAGAAFAGLLAFAADEPAVSGIHLRVVSAETARDYTTVVVEVSGHEDLGQTVATIDRMTLVDASGRTQPFPHRRRPGDDNPRQVALVYDAVAPGPATLALANIGFIGTRDRDAFLAAANEASAQGKQAPAFDQYVHRVQGEWSIALTVADATAGSREIEVHDVSAPYGPGRVFVDRVLVSAAGVHVYGHLSGIERDAITWLKMGPAVLVAGGQSAPMLGGRYGNGDGAASWDFEFGPLEGASAEITIPLAVGFGPPDYAAAADALRPHDGSSATLAIPLQ